MAAVSRFVSSGRVAAAVVCAIVLVGSATAAEPPASLFGRWILDLSKSTYTTGAPPFVRGTRVIEQAPGGMIRITDEMVRPRGGIVHVEWLGQFDGRDYAAEGFEDYAMTYAYRPTGDRSFEIVQKSDGRVVGVGRMELSADGRSLTTVSVNNGTTTVFEKR